MAGMVDKISAALPAVKLTTLPYSLLKFPPSPEPTTLSPPLAEHATLAQPFVIPKDLYNALLEPAVPITVAVVYATVVSYFNTVNKRRDYKPWAFSRTRIFRLLVILHNVVLAVYSAWTFVGMVHALKESLPSWNNEHGAAGVVDSLCKMQGPRGLGNAATYVEQSRAWTMTNRAFHLAADGLGPERTDVGRLWNEGLAFYGWLFYVSKFYEVIDTAIILAKGKKSSFLQTYHHAGAMLSMWAGIRYMSPPIWMFVTFNSAIHALMYTFYLCSALKIHIPKRLKRTLTTLQISQFVVGASYAFIHLFVAYQIPVSVPYLINLAPKVASMAAADASSIASEVVATASADAGSILKKLAFRAAGYEGLAANVGVRSPVISGQAQSIPRQYIDQAETRYKDDLQWVHCLDTSGQTFAILLNCVYLLPLTWLFVRFFIKVYTTRLERRRSSTAAEQARIARQSFNEASRGFARQVSEAVEEMHATADSSDAESPIVETSETVNALKKKASAAAEQVQKRASDAMPDDPKAAIRTKASDAAKSAKENAGLVSEKIAEAQRAVQESASSAVDVVKEKLGSASDAAQDEAPKAEAKAQKGAEKTQEEASNVTQSTKNPDQPASSNQEATKPEGSKNEAKSSEDSAKDEADTSEAESNPVSPNDPAGTGAGEATGAKNESEQRSSNEDAGDEKPKTEDTAAEQEAKKEEDKIIDTSQPVRDDDETEQEEAAQEDLGEDKTKSDGHNREGSSGIPRPKKNKNKKKG